METPAGFRIDAKGNGIRAEAFLDQNTSQKQVMGHEAWYVAVTRARDNLAVFTDSREKLPKVISQVLAKESAIEAVEKSQEKGRGFEIER